MLHPLEARLSSRLNLPLRAIQATLALLDGGATVPFLARYRKEATGGLDEVQIAAVKDTTRLLRDLDDRRETILRSIEEQGKLSPELRRVLEAADTLSILEDLYLPFRPKRKTRATMALEKGLEPLARSIFEGREADPARAARRFVNEAVPSENEALQGARDIIAEWVSENAEARQRLRTLFEREAVIRATVKKGKETEAAKFRDYFDFAEPLRRVPSHRLLALRRGEAEGFLSVSISPDEVDALDRLDRQFLRGLPGSRDQLALALKDAYKRLIRPSLETEFDAFSKEKADAEAIQIFDDNLRNLLLSPPLGQKRVLAIDPGYRSGCKVVCLDAQGNLLANEVIFPLESESRRQQANQILIRFLETYRIEAIAVGNGTAGRETEAFVRAAVGGLNLPVFLVSEQGASIYSASDLAREEFPDHNVTVRGAVSIGRRLMDPLAELVKIDPKSIGVGQYQHDVDQTALKESLDAVVERCVNQVGVSLNTASAHLLRYVSGLGPTLAQNIVQFRAANGPFASRDGLKKVPRLGPKAFEQCAGFLRIEAAENPLDNSAVHPERYAVVERMARDVGGSVRDLVQKPDLRRQVQAERYVSEVVGLPTLRDILTELEKPGRDPRGPLAAVDFDERVKTIADLHEGMVLNGIITNVTAFGAFVDLGVKQDGLVHISQLSHQFVSDPRQVVKVGQAVRVKVLEVDAARKRVALSMKI
ncbi:MAG: RNA-binding transcriptional accessory protein [Sphingobacteriaceae bacterium]|nr:RNA-binding transcriptional accessory protein [Cytophagaceae bacterium]